MSKTKVLVTYWGEGSLVDKAPPIPQDEPKSIEKKIDPEDPFTSKKKIFDQLRSKNYWLTSIQEAESL